MRGRPTLNNRKSKTSVKRKKRMGRGDFGVYRTRNTRVFTVL